MRNFVRGLVAVANESHTDFLDLIYEQKQRIFDMGGAATSDHELKAEAPTG